LNHDLQYIHQFLTLYGIRVVEPLLERGLEGYLILLVAAFDNRIDVMDLLVEEHGVDVNTPICYKDDSFDCLNSIVTEVAEILSQSDHETS
jgi:hypothetical protein